MNFTGAAAAGELVPRPDRRRHLDDAARRAGRPRRRVVRSPRSRLGRLHQRPRPRRPADRGRRPDALRLGDPRRQRSSMLTATGWRGARSTTGVDPDRRPARARSRSTTTRRASLDVEVVHVPVLDRLRRGALGSRSRPSRKPRRRTPRRPSSSTSRFLEHCRAAASWSAIEAVADARRRRRSSFHCHGGKDRTGLVAALLLAARRASPIEDDRRRLRAQRASRLQPRHDAVDRRGRERGGAGARSSGSPPRRRRRCTACSTATRASDYGGVERATCRGGGPSTDDDARARPRARPALR